jgi:hypothetical protein
MSPSRPSNHEIFSKVEKALEAIACGNRQIGPASSHSADFDECAIYDEADLWKKLPKLLLELKEELKQRGPVLCYAGYFPPMFADDHFLNGLELWPYHWDSKIMNFRIYLKFCIKIAQDGRPHYLHVSLHEDRPEDI